MYMQAAPGPGHLGQAELGRCVSATACAPTARTWEAQQEDVKAAPHFMCHVSKRTAALTNANALVDQSVHSVQRGPAALRHALCTRVWWVWDGWEEHDGPPQLQAQQASKHTNSATARQVHRAGTHGTCDSMNRVALVCLTPLALQQVCCAGLPRLRYLHLGTATETRVIFGVTRSVVDARPAVQPPPAGR